MDEYRIEELDDERTLYGNLVQDCERDETVENELDLAFSPILEYVAEFIAVIDACGMVSYFMNMKRCVEQNVSKAKDVAAAYQHDLRYYTKQYNDWRFKARRSFNALVFQAQQLGYEMPDQNDLLNGLTLYEGRRDCYKYYLNSYLKKNATFSPMELEKKYHNRLKKRLKRKS